MTGGKQQIAGSFMIFGGKAVNAMGNMARLLAAYPTVPSGIGIKPSVKPVMTGLVREAGGGSPP